MQNATTPVFSAGSLVMPLPAHGIPRPLASIRPRLYSSSMEIPLRLKKSADGRLSYGISLWYRLVTAAMLGLVIAGLLSTESPPGLFAWVILLLLLMGLVYEERWTVDPASKTVCHHGGFWPFTKAVTTRFDSVGEFHLQALARGTVPGSKEETSVNAKAFDMMNHKDVEQGFARGFFKSASRVPYINLLMKTAEGELYLVDSLPARRAARLAVVGTAFADACGSRFMKNQPE